MHLLIALYRYFDWGGLQLDARRIMDEALRRGHQVTVFCTQWDNPPEDIHVEKTAVRGMTNCARMRHFVEDWKRRLEVGDVDVSLAMNRVPEADFFFAGDVCMRAFYRRRRLWPLLRLLPRYHAVMAMERETITCPKTQILHISPMQKTDYIREYGVDASRFHLLPPGMDPACRRPDEEATAASIRQTLRRQLGLQDDQLLLIQVGSGLKAKGMDRTIAAVAALPPPLRNRCRLAIVGNAPAAKLRDIAKAHHMEHQLILPGARHDVPQWLLAADAMLHPAREEGAGSVLVEGIAAGIPVLCSAACGFAPYVQAAAGYVTDEPFRQEAFNAMSVKLLQNLSEATAQTRAYAKTQDFCRRAAVVVDVLERKHLQEMEL